MNTSDHGLQFLGGWEGLRNALYDDGGPGVGNCTIGIGHLVHYGPCDGREEEQPFLNGLSDDECYALLRQDLPRYEAVVDGHATVPLNQHQYDALVDFCYNTGGNYPAVWAAVNGGGDVGAVLVKTAITPTWATAALVRRRQAEADLYNTPVNEEEAMTPEEKQRFDDLAASVWNHGLQLNEFGKAFFPLAMAYYTTQAVDAEQQARLAKLEKDLGDLAAFKP